jgi:hypothetical protein
MELELLFTAAKFVVLGVAALFVSVWGQRVLAVLMDIRDRLPEKHSDK